MNAKTVQSHDRKPTPNHVHPSRTNAPGGVDIQVIAFDADDTLWHNEDDFAATETAFAELLAPWASVDEAKTALFTTETRNLHLFGYGVKSFTLSMIEAAMELSGGAIDSATLGRLLDRGKEMLARPAELLPGVHQVIEDLATQFPLFVITKGDLHHQERKVQLSGIAHLFSAVEVVSEKDTYTYEKLLQRHEVVADRFVMVGNSTKSDIIPPLQLGCTGIHIPYAVTWEHEKVSDAQCDSELGPHRERFHALRTIGELPSLLRRIKRKSAS
jgi:putative hydrolase of the HAD superfamily